MTLAISQGKDCDMRQEEAKETFNEKCVAALAIGVLVGILYSIMARTLKMPEQPSKPFMAHISKGLLVPLELQVVNLSMSNEPHVVNTSRRNESQEANALQSNELQVTKRNDSQTINVEHARKTDCTLVNISQMLTTSLSDGSILNASSCQKSFIGDSVNGSCNKFRFYSRKEAISLMNRTSTHFIGDSVTRRFVLQLRSYLNNEKFKDVEYHFDKDLSIHKKTFNVGLQYYWKPSIANKLTTLAALSQRNRSENFVFVGGPDHDFSYQSKSSPKQYYKLLNKLHNLLLVLSKKGSKVSMDGVLYSHHRSTEPYELEAGAALTSTKFLKNNFAYLDMFNWVMATERRNHRCTRRDHLGIHLESDFLRLLHVQAWLNFVEYFLFGYIGGTL